MKTIIKVLIIFIIIAGLVFISRNFHYSRTYDFAGGEVIKFVELNDGEYEVVIENNDVRFKCTEEQKYELFSRGSFPFEITIDFYPFNTGNNRYITVGFSRTIDD